MTKKVFLPLPGFAPHADGSAAMLECELVESLALSTGEAAWVQVDWAAETRLGAGVTTAGKLLDGKTNPLVRVELREGGLVLLDGEVRFNVEVGGRGREVALRPGGVIWDTNLFGAAARLSLSYGALSAAGEGWRVGLARGSALDLQGDRGSSHWMHQLEKALAKHRLAIEAFVVQDTVDHLPLASGEPSNGTLRVNVDALIRGRFGTFQARGLEWDPTTGFTLHRTRFEPRLDASDVEPWVFTLKEGTVVAVAGGKPVELTPGPAKRHAVAPRWLRLDDGWLRLVDAGPPRSDEIDGLPLPAPADSSLDWFLALGSERAGSLGPLPMSDAQGNTKELLLSVEGPALTLRMRDAIRVHHEPEHVAPTADPSGAPMDTLELRTCGGEVEGQLRAVLDRGGLGLQTNAGDTWLRLPGVVLDTPPEWAGAQGNGVTDRRGLVPVPIEAAEEAISLRPGRGCFSLHGSQVPPGAFRRQLGLRLAPDEPIYGLAVPGMLGQPPEQRGLEFRPKHGWLADRHAVALLDRGYGRDEEPPDEANGIDPWTAIRVLSTAKTEFLFDDERYRGGPTVISDWATFEPPEAPAAAATMAQLRVAEEVVRISSEHSLFPWLGRVFSQTGDVLEATLAQTEGKLAIDLSEEPAKLTGTLWLKAGSEESEDLVHGVALELDGAVLSAVDPNEGAKGRMRVRSEQVFVLWGSSAAPMRRHAQVEPEVTVDLSAGTCELTWAAAPDRELAGSVWVERTGGDLRYVVAHRVVAESEGRFLVRELRGRGAGETQPSYEVSLLGPTSREATPLQHTEVHCLADRLFVVWPKPPDDVRVRAFPFEVVLRAGVTTTHLSRVFVEARQNDDGDYAVCSGIIGWRGNTLGAAAPYARPQVTEQYEAGSRRLVIHGVWQLAVGDVDLLAAFDDVTWGARGQRAHLDVSIARPRLHFALPARIVFEENRFRVEAHVCLLDRPPSTATTTLRRRNTVRIHHRRGPEQGFSVVGVGVLRCTSGTGKLPRPTTPTVPSVLPVSPRIQLADEPLAPAQAIAPVGGADRLELILGGRLDADVVDVSAAVRLEASGAAGEAVWFDTGLARVEAAEQVLREGDRVRLLRRGYGLAEVPLPDGDESVEKRARRALRDLTWRRAGILESVNRVDEQPRLVWQLVDSPLEHDALPFDWLEASGHGCEAPPPAKRHGPTLEPGAELTVAASAHGDGAVPAVAGKVTWPVTPVRAPSIVRWTSNVPFELASRAELGPWSPRQENDGSSEEAPYAGARQPPNGFRFEQAVERPGELLTTHFVVGDGALPQAATPEKTIRTPRAGDDPRALPLRLSTVGPTLVAHADERRPVTQGVAENGTGILVGGPERSGYALGQAIDVFVIGAKPGQVLLVETSIDEGKPAPVVEWMADAQAEATVWRWRARRDGVKVHLSCGLRIPDSHADGEVFHGAFTVQSSDQPEMSLRFVHGENDRTVAVGPITTTWTDHVGLLRAGADGKARLVSYGALLQPRWQLTRTSPDDAEKPAYAWWRQLVVTDFTPSPGEYMLFRLRHDGSMRLSERASLSALLRM